MSNTMVITASDYTARELEDKLEELKGEGWFVESSTMTYIIMSRKDEPQELLD